MYFVWENWAVAILGVFMASVFTVNYLHYMKMTGVKTAPAILVFLLLLWSALFPIYLLSFLFLAVYRQIVKLILILKYGNKFMNLLESKDVVHALSSEHNCPLHFAFIIEYDSTNAKSFPDLIKEKTEKAVRGALIKNSKMFGAIRKSMGYSYLLKNDFVVEEYIKAFPTIGSPAQEINKTDYFDLLSNHTSVPLPDNGKALWDITLGAQPITWKKVSSDMIKYYPLLIRIHHSLGDGVSFVKIIFKMFENLEHCINITSLQNNDKDVIPKKQTSNDNSKLSAGHSKNNSWQSKAFSIDNILTWTLNASTYAREKLMYYCKKFYIACLIPSIVLRQSLTLPTQGHLLYGPKLTNRKLLAFNVDEERKYLNMTKNIKRKLKGLTFYDVILTAVSASLHEYFLKKVAHVPECVVVETPLVPHATALVNVTLDELMSQETPCENDLSYSIRKLPIDFSDKDRATPLIDRLQEVKKDGHLLQNSSEALVNYWAMSVFFGLFPEPILRFLARVIHVTSLISNLPGPPAFKLMGYPVQEFAAFGASRKRTGLVFLAFTYDQRLVISLAADEAIISNQRDVQSILNGIYQNLDKMNMESNITGSLA